MEYSLQKTVINKAEVNFYLDWVPSKKKIKYSAIPGFFYSEVIPVVINGTYFEHIMC